jgi:hypothetical protein
LKLVSEERKVEKALSPLKGPDEKPWFFLGKVFLPQSYTS